MFKDIEFSEYVYIKHLLRSGKFTQLLSRNKYKTAIAGALLYWGKMFEIARGITSLKQNHCIPA